MYSDLKNYKYGWRWRDKNSVGMTLKEYAYGDFGRDVRATTIMMGQSARMHTGLSAGIMYWQDSDTDLTWYIKEYYMHHQFHKDTGLKKITGFEFANGDIHRQIIEYENGTKVWVNRSKEDWEVEKYLLPKYGFLVKGENILEYSVINNKIERHWLDYMETKEEIYADPMGKKYDFGKVVTNTQVAIQYLSKGVIKIIPYPVALKGELILRIDNIESGRDYRKTKIAAYNGVGNFLGEVTWKKTEDGIKIRTNAVKGTVFYVVFQKGTNLKKVRWYIGTDLMPIEPWEYKNNNLVQSSGFEEKWYGLHGWNMFADPKGVKTGMDHEVSHNGQCSLRLRFNGQGSSRYKQRWQWIKVEKGKSHKLSYYIKTENLNHKLGLFVPDNPNKFLYPPYYTNKKYRRQSPWYTKGTSDWRYVEMSFTANKNNMDRFNRVLLAIQIPSKHASGTAWIDDVAITEDKLGSN